MTISKNSKSEVFHYAYLEANADAPIHSELLGHLAAFVINLGHGQTFNRPTALIAEITQLDDAFTNSICEAKELGARVLLLGERGRVLSVPEPLIGVSSVNPNGVLYSAPFVAKSAITTFLQAHYALSPQGALNRLHLLPSQDPFLGPYVTPEELKAFDSDQEIYVQPELG